MITEYITKVKRKVNTQKNKWKGGWCCGHTFCLRTIIFLDRKRFNMQKKSHTTCVRVHGIRTTKAIICMFSMREAHTNCQFLLCKLDDARGTWTRCKISCFLHSLCDFHPWYEFGTCDKIFQSCFVFKSSLCLILLLP